MTDKQKPALIQAAERGVTAEDGSSLAKFERAALQLFTQKSIDATTTKQIAAAAGLSEGLLYRYAPSKMALAENMFFAIHSRLGALVRKAGAIDGDINTKVTAVVDAYTRCADDDWTLFSYHLLTTHRFLQDDRSTDNPVDATEDILRAAMDTGEIPHGDIILLAAMVLGVVQQPALHKAYGRLDADLSNYRTEMTSAIISILHQRDAKQPQ